MFGIFKRDPVKKLEDEYARKLTEAVEAQRNGKIETYSKLIFESEEILKQIEELKGKK
jgi:hypothetical protein